MDPSYKLLGSMKIGQEKKRLNVFRAFLPRGKWAFS